MNYTLPELYLLGCDVVIARQLFKRLEAEGETYPACRKSRVEYFSP